MKHVFVGDDNVSHGFCIAKYVNLHRNGGFIMNSRGFGNANRVTDQILQTPLKMVYWLIIMCRLDCYVKRNGIQFTHLDYIFIPKMVKKVLRVFGETRTYVPSPRARTQHPNPDIQNHKSNTKTIFYIFFFFFSNVTILCQLKLDSSPT